MPGPGRSWPDSHPESKVERGQESELWLDTTKMHLFDPQSGERLG